MSITNYTTVNLGGTVQVLVTSDLVGVVHYHWFADGLYVGHTLAANKFFVLGDGEQLKIEVIDTLDPVYNVAAAAPLAYPARRTLSWVRSIDADVAYYEITEQAGTADPVVLGTVLANAKTWDYSYRTGRLTDLTTYTWTITPYDAAGNAGTPLVITELVVRVPEAPGFTATFDEGTTLVTIAGAE
jgi:hypothetical protein